MNEVMPLWSHQQAALNWLQLKKNNHASGVMLAMGMGTGKTRIAIEWMKSQRDSQCPYPNIVFCPKPVLDVWARQLNMFGGDLEPLILNGNASLWNRSLAIERFITNGRPTCGKVVVLNYESLAAAPNDAISKSIICRQWACAILDESHRIKAAKGLRSKLLNKIKAMFRFKIAMTGTPMPHSPDDIYGQFRFLNSDVLGTTHQAFKYKYAIMQNRPGIPVPIITGWKNQDDLAARLQPHMLNVNRDDVLDLPPEVHVERFVELEDSARTMYDELKNDMITWYRGNGTEAEPVTTTNALVRLLRLQQITGGFATTDDHRIIPVSKVKAEALGEVLEELSPQEPVIVLCRYKADIDAATETCRAAGRTVAMLRGQCDELNFFQNGGASVLVAQQQCAKEGIDLTRAHYCVLWSINWSLGDYEQALARLRRPGQEAKKVVYIHLIASNTVDEDLRKALIAKKFDVMSVLERMR